MDQAWKERDLSGEAAGIPDDRQGPPGRWKRTTAALAAALLVGAGGYGIRAVTASSGTPPAGGTAPATAAVTAVQQTGDISSLVQRAEKAVVRVASQVSQQGPFGQSVTGQAVGTGFVLSSDGLILTNYHVVEGAGGITATLSDGTTSPASVVKTDPSGDLAELKIDRSGLETLPLGDSSQVLTGQSVVAIGYALDLQGSPTVTTGIVSSTGRTIQVADEGGSVGPAVRTYRNLIQISAAINAGNSGGPLLDLQGRVIGIDTAGAQGADNVGFAIPIDQAKALVGFAG